MTSEAGSDEDFYIGWSADPPVATMAFVRSRVLGVMAGVLLLATVLTAFQRPFAPSSFEFGVDRTFEGVVDSEPFPTLVVERPAGDLGDHSARWSRWLLTVFGKYGAGEATNHLDGHRVRFTGSLIHRGDAVMVEIQPETLEDLGEVAAPTSIGRPTAGSSSVVLTGEIVDSKCFLGVMKPGNLKPHRACAVRCISGGVPPVLVTRDEEGVATYRLLVGADGAAINAEVLDYVAEPVEISGRLTHLDGMQILWADPVDIRRVN